MSDTLGGPDMSDTLAPRPPRPSRRRRPVLAAGIALAVAGAVVFLVVNLVSGSLYFYNADEAVERRDELGDDRFTLQGSPVRCSVTRGFDDGTVVAFSVFFGGVAVDVVHRGAPAELFEEEVTVVLDGAWAPGAAPVSGFEGLADDGWHFASDRMRVKHDNDYRNDDGYDERLSEGAQAVAEAAAACEI